MDLSNEDVNAITQIALLSGVDENDVIKVFESFLILFTLDYKSKKSIHVPYVGNFLIKYKGDSITEDGREALVDAFYSPSDKLRRIIGQLADIEESKNPRELDTYKILKRMFNKDFKLKLEKEDLE